MIVASVAAVADVPTSQTIASDSAADTNGKYTISVASSDTHTYKVYQILTGSLIAGETKLGDPKWGADAKTTPGTNTGVEAFITSITTGTKSNAEINDLVGAQLATDATGRGTVDKANSMNVAPGYYLIVDQTAELADGETLSLNIVAVFNDITIATKRGTTESDKKVDDVNDSTGDSALLQESADYDIGDHVPYTLTAKLPDGYENYKKFYLQFQDDMSKGLTLDTASVKIYYGASDTTGTSIEFTAAEGSEYTDGHLYTYTIADVKTAAPSLKAGDVITIKYTATLNKDAVITDKGNPNKSRVLFSKNPNWDGNGTPDTNDTPWKTTVVFTYKTVFNKVDGVSKKPLTGADFKLEKFVKNESGADEYKGAQGTWTDVTTLGSGDDKPSKTKEDLTKGEDTAANAKFTFAGLDDGYYRLVETATPEGYNTMDPKYFEITASHTVTGLESLAGADGQTFTLTATKTEGKLEADIENNQGSQLPSTGGIGTTLFYIGGGILVLAAVILLVTKRRMNAND